MIHPAFYGVYRVVHSRASVQASIEVYQLIEGQYQRLAANERGHYLISPLGIELGIWQGRYQDVELPWLRWWKQGNLLLTGERANQAEERAEQLAAPEV